MNNINNIEILKYVISKYNLLRIILFDLLNYYTSVYNYYKQYMKFISYVWNNYPQLAFIYENKIKIYTIPNNNKNDKKSLNLPKDTFIIVGINNYYKYKSIKYILRKIMTYDKNIHNYLIYLETCIIRLANGMNKFNRFYTYSLNIFFNYNTYISNDSNSLLNNSFNTLKQNYLHKCTQYLNN